MCPNNIHKILITTVLPCFLETFLHTQLLCFVQDAQGLTQIRDVTFCHPKIIIEIINNTIYCINTCIWYVTPLWLNSIK